MSSISSVHMDALINYLRTKYGVVMLQESLPFLILWCKNGSPPPDKRPFLIASCIAVWLNEGDRVPPDICVGDFGELDPIKVDDSISDNLRSYHMLEDETLLRILTEYFPEADHIAYISHTVIVEFPREDTDSWYRRLLELPS